MSSFPVYGSALVFQDMEDVGYTPALESLMDGQGVGAAMDQIRAAPFAQDPLGTTVDAGIRRAVYTVINSYARPISLFGISFKF